MSRFDFLPLSAGSVEADFDSKTRRVGDAWMDTTFLSELRARHEGIGAGSTTARHLDLLAAGKADCIVTGQQPAILGGPLYTAYKLAGCIAAARWHQERTGRTTVPVYWNGGDDSDFDEARGAWLWSRQEGALRVELPAGHFEEGLRIGSLPGAEFAARERPSLEFALEGEARQAALDILERMDAQSDLGDRQNALLDALFPEAGVVFVDARSPRLRELGSELFARYARRHQDVSRALLSHSEQLVATGGSAPLGDEALQSALFAIDGERRRKIAADELGSAVSKLDLSPSVVLRPVWQDDCLAPVAAVLGPSELAYHRQLQPLFESLEVTPAARLARPRLCCVPDGMGELAVEAGEELLYGGDRLRLHLAVEGLESRERSALRSLREDLNELLNRVENEGLGPYAAELRALGERWTGDLDRAAESWAAKTLQRRVSGGLRWDRVPALLDLRGKPQERAYSTFAAFAWFGTRYAELLSAFVDRTAVSYAEGSEPAFVVECTEDLG